MLHIDGNWYHEVDKMGGGGVIRDNNGRWISGFALVFGAGDAFKAELTTILCGLAHTWRGLGL